MNAPLHIAFLLATPTLRDDEGLLPAPTGLWHWENWSWELSIVLPLFFFLFWYGIGAYRRGRQPRLRKHHLAFAAGWISLAFALISPLHRLGDVLFSAHMLQHEILLLIAAPLFAASHPGVTWLYALPRTSRRPLGGLIARIENHASISIIFSPLGAFLVHAAALWLWHIPYLYQATLDSDFIHAFQHLSFVLSGILFWSALFGAGRSTMTCGAGVLYVFGTEAHCSALGALLTFSSVIWYPIYTSRTELWHLTPLQDQQLGGLLMWVPSGVVFIVIGIWLFARWLAASEDRLKHGVLGDLALDAKERA
ncbi:MAG TPA: cytochrome c oxidase assembly protein [Terracidiphilus sp.]|nr:cytochrome c oxidase assembly protein [Terracidiphilus sp.]